MDKARYIVFPGINKLFSEFTTVINKEPPDPNNRLQFTELVNEHHLKHGDVLNLSPDYRFSECYILNKIDALDNISWIKNPDDSGSGYLTIPGEILHTVSDFATKYSDFINQSDEIPCMNFHPSGKDVFITKLFGEHHPFANDEWEFDVGYVGMTEPEYVTVKPRGKPVSTSLTLSNLTKNENGTYPCQVVLDYFSTESSSFSVKVHLEAEFLDKYKQKYGGTKSYSWMSEMPKVPSSWVIEKGDTSLAGNKCEWTWKLKGPSDCSRNVKDAVASFLEGFNYNIVDNKE